MVLIWANCIWKPFDILSALGCLRRMYLDPFCYWLYHVLVELKWNYGKEIKR